MLKAHEYKYQGILFNEFGNFDSAVELLADSVLGAIISKYKTLKNVRFHSFTRMYNAGVMPVLEYGAEIWHLFQKHCILGISGILIKS